jgi:DNA repair protein RadC
LLVSSVDDLSVRYEISALCVESTKSRVPFEDEELLDFSDKPAEIEITYKCKRKPSLFMTVNTSLDSVFIFRKAWSNDLEFIEESYMILLNNANCVLGCVRISKGGLASTVIDLRIVFAIALKCLSTAIIIAHNHPAGNLYPSESDILLTKRICEAGKLIGIAVLDHIILTREGYYSFSDEGFI